MFPGYIFEYNLLGIEGISDNKCLGKEPWKFKGFRDEKMDKKSRKACPQALGRRASQSPSGQTLSNRPWRATPVRVPQDRLYLSGSGTPRLSYRQGRLETPFIPHLFVVVPK